MLIVIQKHWKFTRIHLFLQNCVLRRNTTNTRVDVAFQIILWHFLSEFWEEISFISDSDTGFISKMSCDHVTRSQVVYDDDTLCMQQFLGIGITLRNLCHNLRFS